MEAPEATPTRIGINLDGELVGDRSALHGWLDLFATLGFDCVEITPLGLIRNRVLNGRACSSLLNALSGYDFSYTVHAPMEIDLANRSSFRFSEKMAKACIEFSALLDAKILVLHSGYVRPEGKIPTPKAMETLVSLTRRCASYAGNMGISVGIENGELAPIHFCRRIDRLLDVIKGIGMDNVGVTFDFGHAYLSANYYGFDFMGAVREALPFIIHVHVTDNFGKFNPSEPGEKDTSLGLGDLHLPIGWGSVPYRDVFRLIRPVYKGVYLMEIDRRYKRHLRSSAMRVREPLG